MIRRSIGTAALLVVLGAADARALGDVTATVTSGKLTVTGDDAPNAVQVLAGVGPGAFIVAGIDGTLVNGSLSTTVSGVKKLSIDMKDGVDRVELLDVVLDGSLLVNLGDGSDSFVMQGGRVRTKAEIKGGKESDDIRIRQGARFGDHLFVRGGKKIDTIVVTDASIGGDSEIKGGGGNDTITVQFTTLDDGANLVVGGGDGDDHTLLTENAFEHVQVYMGDGDDELQIEGCDFEGELRAEGNDGDDTIDFEGDNSFDPRLPRRVTGFEDLDLARMELRHRLRGPGEQIEQPLRVVGALPEGPHDVGNLTPRMCGVHDDRNSCPARIGAEGPAQGDAIHARHRDVQDDHAREPARAQIGQRLEAVVRRDDVVSGDGEHAPQDLPRIRVVFDHEHGTADRINHRA